MVQKAGKDLVVTASGQDHHLLEIHRVVAVGIVTDRATREQPHGRSREDALMFLDKVPGVGAPAPGIDRAAEDKGIETRWVEVFSDVFIRCIETGRAQRFSDTRADLARGTVPGGYGHQHPRGSLSDHGLTVRSGAGLGKGRRSRGPSPLPSRRPETDHGLVIAAIIVPLSGDPLSQRALRPAREVARYTDSPVRLISVVSSDEEAAARRSELRTLVHSFAPLSAESRVVVAPRPDVVNPLLTDVTADHLVVMASHADIFRGDAFVGSVTEAVTDRHPGSVLVVGPACDLDSSFDVDRVVVFCDEPAASHQLIEHAASWARILDVALLVTGSGTAAEMQRQAHPLRACDLDVDWAQLDRNNAADQLLELVTRGGLPVVAGDALKGLERIAQPSISTEICARSPRPVVVRHR